MFRAKDKTEPVPDPPAVVEPPRRSAEVSVTTEEFDLVWRHLGLETKPLVLNVVSGVVAFEDDVRERQRVVWDGLRAKDLATHGPRLDSRFEELLYTLAKPSRKIDARLRLGERRVRAMAAARGGVGVLAWLEDGRIHLDAARETGLSSEITGLLPTVAAGEGLSVSIPTELLRRLAAEGVVGEQAMVNALTEGGVRADDARMFVMISRGERTAGGQFGLELADRWGRAHRAGSVVGWFDSPKGRYLMQSLPSGDRSYTTISPAATKRLAQRIDELARLISQVG